LRRDQLLADFNPANGLSQIQVCIFFKRTIIFWLIVAAAPFQVRNSSLSFSQIRFEQKATLQHADIYF
jgi:hypothetical protein